jgi:hypothetical protein
MAVNQQMVKILCKAFLFLDLIKQFVLVQSSETLSLFTFITRRFYLLRDISGSYFKLGVAVEAC